MIKNTFFLILTTFLLAGCAERGSNINVTETTLGHKEEKKAPFTERAAASNTTPKIISIKTDKKMVDQNSSKVTQVQQEFLESNENNKIKSVEKATQEIIKIEPEEDSLFSIDDETKNTLSGILVFIIGIIILL